jgi:hypothetical protein
VGGGSAGWRLDLQGNCRMHSSVPTYARDGAHKAVCGGNGQAESRGDNHHHCRRYLHHKACTGTACMQVEALRNSGRCCTPNMLTSTTEAWCC